MPTIITTGGASAKAFGFGSSSALISYMGQYQVNNLQAYGIANTPTGGVILAQNGPSWISSLSVNSLAVPTNYYAAVQVGSHGGGSGSGMTIDSSGNYYLSGQNVDSSIYNAFIAKINSSNSQVWQVLSYPSESKSDSVSGPVAVDSSGNVYACGSSFDASGPNEYGWVAKFNSSGTQQWLKSYTYSSGGGSTYFVNSQVVLDSSNNVYVIGNGQGVFGYVVKLNNSGTIQWNYQIQLNTTSANTTPFACGFDSSNNLYLIGYNYSGGATGYKPWVAQMSTSGTINWMVSLGTIQVNGVVGCVDSSGNTYICYSNTYSASLEQWYLTKLNSSGSVVWSNVLRQTATTNNSGLVINSITTDNKGSIYLGGSTYVGSGSTYYSYYAKLPADGSKTGTYTFGSSTISYSPSSESSSSQAYTINSVATSSGGSISFSSGNQTWTSETLQSSSEIVF